MVWRGQVCPEGLDIDYCFAYPAVNIQSRNWNLDLFIYSIQKVKTDLNFHQATLSKSQLNSELYYSFRSKVKLYSNSGKGFGLGK
jgi:hypothetical protein